MGSSSIHNQRLIGHTTRVNNNHEDTIIVYHEYTGHVTQRRRIIVVPFPRTRMDMLLMQLDQSVVQSGELRSPTSWDSPRGTMTLVLVAAPAGLAWSRRTWRPTSLLYGCKQAQKPVSISKHVYLH